MRSHRSLNPLANMGMSAGYNIGGPISGRSCQMYGVRYAVLTFMVLTVVTAGDGMLGLASADAASEQAIPQAELTMVEYLFDPMEPVVAAGAGVRLRIVNQGIRRHNVVVQVDGVERASPATRPGEVVEWDVAIERPGRYLFWCGEYRHLEKGMTGTLIVE